MKRIGSIILSVIILCAVFIASYYLKSHKSGSASADIEKYNNYIELNNYINNMLSLSLQGYFSEFGTDKEIKFKKEFDVKKFNGSTIVPVNQNNIDGLGDTMSYTSQKPSFGTADASMKDLCAKLKVLYTTINEMDAYYRSKAFLDDNFAKGKELHKKFISQYNDAFAAYDKFFSDFKTIIEEKKQGELNKLKDKDYMVTYYAKSIVTVAKDIQADFTAADINEDNVLGYDVNKYKAKYDILVEDINKYLEYSKDESRLKKEGLTSNAGFAPFNSSLEGLKASAATIMQVLQTKDKKQTGNLISMYDRNVSFLISYFNSMIK